MRLAIGFWFLAYVVPLAESTIPIFEVESIIGQRPVYLILQRGKGSWYGRRFHGRRTANGERFNRWQFTAAHKSLPFDEEIIVRNLENGKEVRVKINDRGPVPRGRIIDLSQAAADELGMLKKGVCMVEIIKEGMP